MKTLLLSFLIFISATMLAQDFAQVEKVESIYASQHYTITVISNNKQKTYELTKHQASWLLKHNNYTRKVFWDNYYNLERLLKKEIYDYYGTKSKQPSSNNVSYIIANPTDTVTFKAEYINIAKYLRHVGWEQNGGGKSGGSLGGTGSKHG